jgi:hypothetical protein
LCNKREGRSGGGPIRTPVRNGGDFGKKNQKEKRKKSPIAISSTEIFSTREK